MKKIAALMKRSTSMLLALVMLLSMFSVLTVFAESTEGYYKTAASLDYEKANPLTSKVEGVTVTTLNNGSVGYLHANPETTTSLSIAPISGLAKDSTYTYKIDYYLLDYSNDSGGSFAAFFLQNNDGNQFQDWVHDYKANLNQWYTYEFKFTSKSDQDNWTKIFAYGEANIIYDNLRIIDENGKTVFSENFETEKYTLPDGFSYVQDYTSGTGDAYDKALHLTNTNTDTTTDSTQQGTIGGDSVGVDNATTEYTVSFDYMILNKHTTTETEYDFAFELDNYCTKCWGEDSHDPTSTSQWFYGGANTTNVWYSAKETITFASNCTNIFARVSLYTGTELLINNIKVTSPDGTVVMDYNMDSGTVKGDVLTSFSGEKEIITLNELVWCKGIPDTEDGHLYVDASNLLASNKYVDIAFELSENVAASSYPYVTFDYRVLDGTTIDAGKDMTAVSFNGSTATNNIQSQSLSGYTVGEWANSGQINYNNVAMTAGSGNFIRFYVYSGVEIEIDNIKVYQQNGTVPIADINFATNGTFTEESDEAVLIEEKDYAILIDNSAGSGFGELYFNELGMPSPSAPAGTYTVEYDFYALSVGNCTIPYAAKTTDWNGSAIAQVWKDNLPLVENEWVTISFTATATDIVGYQMFWIGAGIKGYMDNFKLIASDGTVYSNFEMTASELGKTSKTINTVVALPQDVAEAKTPVENDYAFLIDNSNGTGNIEFTSNQIGQPYPITEAGTYTVEIDFYALSVGNQIFAFTPIFLDSSNNWVNMEQHYTSSAGFVANEWVTLSFDITTTSAISFWRIHVGAGVKGYIDNVRFIDSSGNEVVNFAMSENENGKTVTGVGSVGELSQDVAEAKTPAKEPVYEGDNYTVSYVLDGVGMKTYGSNGVLKITAGTSAYVYNLNADTIGYTLTTGKKYRLSFGYSVLKVAADGKGYNVAVLRAADNDNQYIVSQEPTSGAVEYEFTARDGGIAFHVYAGAEVAFDNILLEEYVTVDETSAPPVELKAQKYVDGADTYIDITVDTTTSAKTFTLNLAYDSNHLEYVSGTGENSSVSVANSSANPLAVTIKSTSKTLGIFQQAITGEIATLTFKIKTVAEADVTFTADGFTGVTAEILPVTVSFNTRVISLGALKHENGAVVFGMQLAADAAGNDNIDGESVTEKGFIAAIGYHLDAELALDSYNPYVKKIAVNTAESSGTGSNVYTLEVTEPEVDYPVAVRPYAVTASGTHYGDAISSSANDLNNIGVDVWKGQEEITSDANLSIDSAAAQVWQGANAISQGFIFYTNYTNAYTDEQIATELERIDDMDIQMVRSYYDQTYSAKYDAATKTITYDWNTAEMQGLVKWLKAMEERGVEVALNMSWGVNDVYVNHCTTYSYDDCGTANGGHEWTVDNADNPFWCLYNQVNESAAIAAYGDWVAESMKYLVDECGLTNVKYLIMFTEPQQNADYPNQWSIYQSLVKSAHDALTTANIRDSFKMVGPNIALQSNSYAAQLDETGATYINDMEDILPLIKDYIDIYSFHFYAPNWPADGVTAEDPTDNNYELYAKHFESFISTINQYDSGADYWLDEWNYGGEFIDSEYYATQLAQAVVAALNNGVENVMLWQLFETKWPEREDTGGEFVNGIHSMGLAPSLTESDVPHDVYYAYTLLTKYMGKTGATVYKGTGDNGVYTAMIENTDGTQSILVVNTNQSAKTVNITVDKDVNGTLLRHLYNPSTVTPSADAIIITADKAFDDVSQGLTDVIPAGGIAVYTTDKD